MEVLTNTPNPTDYIKKMRKRDEELSKGWGQFVTPLYMETAGGKQQINCANAKGLLRTIQSIPSPKAEPFKLWLAQVGSDRLDEIENPELATQRTRELYKLKGYPDDWIEKRMRKYCHSRGVDWRMEEQRNKGTKGIFDTDSRNFKSDIWVDSIGIQEI
jgi:DNA-damage-inducible protein D